jgi:hypothetical protein
MSSNDDTTASLLSWAGASRADEVGLKEAHTSAKAVRARLPGATHRPSSGLPLSLRIMLATLDGPHGQGLAIGHSEGASISMA